MKKRQRIFSAFCGVATSALQLYLIPRFVMRGVEDVVWGLLMVLLPAAAAVVLLHIIGKCPPRAVFWSLLVEWGIAFVFHRPIGDFLGYRIRSIAWDLFDLIAYLMFAFGWAAAATLAQFVVLFVLTKCRQRQR